MDGVSRDRRAAPHAKARHAQEGAAARMKLVWHPLTRHDFADLIAFVSEDNPKAVRGIVQRIRKAALALFAHPALGRPGRVLGTREMFVPRTPYLLPYRVMGGEVEILRVYHTARRRPEHF